MTATSHVSSVPSRRPQNIHHIQLPSKLSECKDSSQKADYVLNVININPTNNSLRKLFNELSIDSSDFITVSRTIWGLIEMLKSRQNLDPSFVSNLLKDFNELLGAEKGKEQHEALWWLLSERNVPSNTAKGVANYLSSQVQTLADAEKLMKAFNTLFTEKNFKTSQELSPYLENLRKQFAPDSVLGKAISKALNDLETRSVSAVLEGIKNDVIAAVDGATNCVDGYCEYSAGMQGKEMPHSAQVVLATVEKEINNKLGPGGRKHHRNRMKRTQQTFVSVMNTVTTQLTQLEADLRKLVAGQMSQIGMNKGQSPLMAAHQKELQTLLVRMDNVLTELMHFVERMDSKNALLAGMRALKEGAEALRHKTDINSKDLNKLKNTFACFQEQIRASLIS